jgi:hypothetical protein
MTIPKQTLEAYAPTAGVRRQQLRENSGKQPGDPIRAADAIIEAVESEEPPLHLILGKVALDRVRDAMAKRIAVFDKWEAVTLGADYPK